MYASWIRHCYRGIYHPRIAHNSSIQGQPEFQNAICNHKIHLSRWNKFKDDTKQRKNRGEPRGIEPKEDTTLKQDEAQKFEEKIQKLPKQKTSIYFEKLRRGSFLKLPPSSTTVRITVPNKAREYNENVRQRISAKILKIVGRFSLSSSKHVDQAAEVVIKPANPILSGKNTVDKSDKVDNTNDNNASQTEKLDEKVAEYVHRHMAAPPGVTPPMVKCGCMGFKLPDNAATSREKKGGKGGFNTFKRRLSKREEGKGELDRRPSHTHRKKMSREVDIREKKSLLHKYNIKSPGAIDADEFSDQNKPIPQRLSHQSRQDKHKSPIYVRYTKKGHRSIGVMPSRQKSTKKNLENKKEMKKTDEMLAKLGLIDDNNLRNKIDGDLFMNIWDILEKAEKRKISGAKEEAESDGAERDLVQAKKNRGVGDDATRSERRQRKTVPSKRRKHDKSDIEQFLDGEMVHHFPLNKKLNLVSRKLASKSKRRRIKVKKRKGGVKRKRTRKIVIKKKKSKPKRCNDDCGDLSQNE